MILALISKINLYLHYNEKSKSLITIDNFFKAIIQSIHNITQNLMENVVLCKFYSK